MEFVKSWLLAMNKDEGAADHVFTEEISRFEARAARAESSLRSAQADLDQITKASSDLCAALQESRLLELDPIHLDDHAATISETLKAVADSAARRQLDAQVKPWAPRRTRRPRRATVGFRRAALAHTDRHTRQPSPPRARYRIRPMNRGPRH